MTEPKKYVSASQRTAVNVTRWSEPPMSLRDCPREKIYFVVNEKHLFKKWPELVSDPHPFAPDECPERIISGRDCWIILTWARLCAVDCPFEPVLSCRAVDNAVCVFHWDDATPAQGVHRCFAVVVQADRPRPALSDLTVMQNGLVEEQDLCRKIPLWPQPGLIPRNPARRTRLEVISYFGSDQYEPHFVKTDAFQEALRQRGVRFANRFQGTWHDYENVDAVLAIRDCPPVVMATKPASKLINAWKARVPAMLGPEPAYRELRRSPLDFLETDSAEAVLDAIDRLQGSPELYQAMVENGMKRAEAFDDNLLAARWIELLEEARERNRRETRAPLLRYARYLWNRQKISLVKRLSGWRD